jgi:hypothetical protein
MSAEYQRFISSMNIDYYKWHDGIGYDLDALRQLSPQELLSVENRLIKRNNKDWRDVEALDVIGSERAINTIKKGLNRSNVEVKVESARKLKARGILNDAEMESFIVSILQTINDSDFGFIKIMDLAQEYPTTSVKQQLLWNTLYGQENIRVQSAALAYFLYGLSSSRWDNNYRSSYLQFKTNDLSQRKVTFSVLCHYIGVDPSTVFQDRPSIRRVNSQQNFGKGAIFFFQLLVIVWLASVLPFIGWGFTAETAISIKLILGVSILFLLILLAILINRILKFSK